MVKPEHCSVTCNYHGIKKPARDFQETYSAYILMSWFFSIAWTTIHMPFAMLEAYLWIIMKSRRQYYLAANGECWRAFPALHLILQDVMEGSSWHTCQTSFLAALHSLSNSAPVSNDWTNSIRLSPITGYKEWRIPLIPSTAQVSSVSAGVSRTVSVPLTEQAPIDRQCHRQSSQGAGKAFMYHYSPLDTLPLKLTLGFVMRSAPLMFSV